MPGDRFRTTVDSALRAAGWSEGRDIGERAERMIADTVAAAAARGENSARRGLDP